jgi:hypothetical protein
MGKIVTKREAFTRLTVIRVIKGDIKPGEHQLMVGYGIGWSAAGEYVSSASSTELPGDVSDITEANLWFLKKERSWDEKDKTEYLSISNYREIQSLSLEEFYSVLGTSKAESGVPKLLASDKPEVINRALRYICGGQWPWPNNSDFEMRYLAPEKRTKVLRNAADAVARVVDRKELGSLRSLAVTVYADMKGKQCVDFVRGLLADEDPNVRAMAISVLLRNKDEQSTDAITRAVNGITNGWMSCKVIESITGWGDIRLVPSAISFLENGDSAGFDGNNLFIPQIKAREALFRMTGHVFPFEVKSSLAAWEKVKNLNDAKKRKEILGALIPCDAMPLKAEVVGTNKKAYLRITNTSRQKTTVTKRPSYGNQCSPGASSGCGFGSDAAVKSEKDFMNLKPGESIQFDVELGDRFLLADPSTREMTVVFDNNGRAYGVNAWIGNLNVEFGKDWKEEREIKNVGEKWPNGNFKAVGQTVNGERFGEWNFFNEKGDRIKTIYYTSNRGSAKCNPEHPSNKGAGIPKNK